MPIVKIEIDPENRIVTSHFDKEEPHSVRYNKVSVAGHLISALIRLTENRVKLDKGIYDK